MIYQVIAFMGRKMSMDFKNAFWKKIEITYEIQDVQHWSHVY